MGKHQLLRVHHHASPPRTWRFCQACGKDQWRWYPDVAAVCADCADYFNDYESQRELPYDAPLLLAA